MGNKTTVGLIVSIIMTVLLAVFGDFDHLSDFDHPSDVVSGSLHVQVAALELKPDALER